MTRKFNVIGRLIIMDDITERIELESQLSQADKLSSIGLLAAGVAHEVNTPLAVISSYAQMLAKQLQGDPQKSRAAGKDYAANVPRVGDRQQPAEFLAHQRNRICRASMSTRSSSTLWRCWSTSSRPQDQGRRRIVPSTCHRSKEMPARLQQVFLNLFLNAKDAMAEGGTLRIATSNGEASA